MELLYTNNDWIRWTIIQYHVSTEYEIPDYNHIHAFTHTWKIYVVLERFRLQQ